MVPNTLDRIAVRGNTAALSSLHRARRRLVLSTLTPAMLVLLGLVAPSQALSPSQQKAYDAFVLSPPRPVTSEQIQKQREQRARQSFQAEESRIQTALKLFSGAAQDTKEGLYEDALSTYEEIITRYGDLALAERSRVSRAILEYQLGKVDLAILHLKDEEVALRGDAEVHCALAVILYAEKPYELNLAEEQYEVAMEFDTRLGDVAYVRDVKRWPPRLVHALEKFKNFGG